MFGLFVFILFGRIYLGISPTYEVAFGVAGTAVENPAAFGFFKHDFTMNALGAFHINFLKKLFGVFALGKTGAGVKFAESSYFNHDRFAALGANFIGRLVSSKIGLF